MVLAHIRKQGFMEVLRQSGIRGLYFGVTATLYRDVSFNAALFTIRELLVRAYEKQHQEEPDPKTRVLLGLPAGCLASFVACPFDVVKTRMQGDELGELGRGYVSVLLVACVG